MFIQFLKFSKEIDDYLSNENTNFVTFANRDGLSNMAEICQRHARKCKETIVPTLSGFKVNLNSADL